MLTLVLHLPDTTNYQFYWILCFSICLYTTLEEGPHFSFSLIEFQSFCTYIRSIFMDTYIIMLFLQVKLSFCIGKATKGREVNLLTDNLLTEKRQYS